MFSCLAHSDLVMRDYTNNNTYQQLLTPDFVASVTQLRSCLGCMHSLLEGSKFCGRRGYKVVPRPFLYACVVQT